jgi:hypothetical protein
MITAILGAILGVAIGTWLWRRSNLMKRFGWILKILAIWVWISVVFGFFSLLGGR